MSNVLYPTTNLKSIENIKFTQGEGIYLFDDKGKKYIDGMAGLWCSALGHGNEELIDAINESQLDELIGTLKKSLSQVIQERSK